MPFLIWRVVTQNKGGGAVESKNKSGVERGRTSIIAIISIIIALLSVSFTAGHLFTTREHNRFDETYDSLAMLYDRLQEHSAWVVTLPVDEREKAERYRSEARDTLLEAEKALRVKNFDLARQRIGEAYASLEKARAAVD